MNQILTWARKIEAKHALFLFDSCFSGMVFKAKALPKMPCRISKMAKLPVRQFITAGSADEMVPAQSVFTPAFIDALRYGLGDLYKDGYVTGEELGLYLKAKCRNMRIKPRNMGKSRIINWLAVILCLWLAQAVRFLHPCSLSYRLTTQTMAMVLLPITEAD